jgi:hypothetical protein
MPSGKPKNLVEFICESCGEKGLGRKGQHTHVTDECRSIEINKNNVKNYIYKTYNYHCKYCGEAHTSSKPKSRVCNKSECKRAYQRDYKKLHPNKKEEVVEIVLVDSICPKCRKKHKAESRWAFCPAHEYLRYETNYFEIQHGVVAP